MTPEVGCYYRTRDGRKAYVSVLFPPSPWGGLQPRYVALGWIEGDDAESSWAADGRCCEWRDTEDPRDLIAPWRDPVTVKGWVNVYEDGSPSRLYATRADADEALVFLCRDRIACVYVEGTES
jgi:hypothetical protein